jgi:hypothetical protein
MSVAYMYTKYFENSQFQVCAVEVASGGHSGVAGLEVEQEIPTALSRAEAR